jgi:hypothetical protein
MTTEASNYWRIRMRDWQSDRTQEAWENNEVGIWYGAWTMEDYEYALLNHPTAISDHLKTCSEKRNPEWKWNPDVGPMRRFIGIKETDWVVVYLRKAKEIGIARVCSSVQSRLNHPFNDGGEIFKYRKITNKKQFRIPSLPDAYSLIPSQGRGNVFQLRGMSKHIELLAESEDESSVYRALATKSFDELLDLLGASAWESFCVAYLILEEGFVPTGLSTGRTLPNLDIVGRRKSDGMRVIAQCKKDVSTESIDERFVEVCASLDGVRHVAYYFAFGGVLGKVPPGVKVVDKAEIVHWTQGENGGRYQQLFLGHDYPQPLAA